MLEYLYSIGLTVTLVFFVYRTQRDNVVRRRMFTDGKGDISGLNWC